MANWAMDFEWDDEKEQDNIKKHRVTFLEAIESFMDQRGLQLTDNAHSKSEKRFYWIGKTASGRILTSRFTIRGSKIRIIGSAEWRKFRRLYETTKIK
jgi:uncharacterized DUF497 family protein